MFINLYYCLVKITWHHLALYYLIIIEAIINSVLEKHSDKTATELSAFSHKDIPWIGGGGLFDRWSGGM